MTASSVEEADGGVGSSSAVNLMSCMVLRLLHGGLKRRDGESIFPCSREIG